MTGSIKKIGEEQQYSNTNAVDGKDKSKGSDMWISRL